jgi:uncharacterized membrane-anchored protein
MNRKLIYFVLAVLVQVIILTAIPAKQVSAKLAGKLITIKTAPVDPYDFLSGYHVVLNYEISSPPGLGELKQEHRKNFPVYVVLKEGSDSIWYAESIHKTWPKDIPDGCIIIKGKWTYSRINYGIESYFIPEKHRREIEEDLRRNARQAKAQVKIDRFGNAALIRLLVDNKVYEY